MIPQNIEQLGDPDLRVGGLSLWVHGLAHADATDYWDANWLLVTAFCRYPGSWASADGTILHLREIAAFLKECEGVFGSASGRAELDCMEPNLRVELHSTGGEHLSARISVTPDHLAQSHTYADQLDQTALHAIIAGCRSILAKYPIRGTPPDEGAPE